MARRPGKVTLVALILVISVCLTGSCTMLFLKMGGYMKDPKLEDRESIKKYCKKHKDPYDLLWMPKSVSGFDTLMARYPALPAVTIYDRNMQVVENADGAGCHKKLVAFLKDTSSASYNKRLTESWSIYQRYCVPADIKADGNDFAYTVVYSWAIYTPRLTKDLFERLNTVKDSARYRIRFISLNRDYQKGVHSEVPTFKADKPD